jgi:hypothetical protein
VITRLVSAWSAAVEPETFKGQELKIVQALEEANAQIFQDTEFPLSKYVSDKGIWDNCWE